MIYYSLELINLILICGCNSVVECLLPMQNVVGSSPIARFQGLCLNQILSIFQSGECDREVLLISNYKPFPISVMTKLLVMASK
jgi:hypothetical protein